MNYVYRFIGNIINNKAFTVMTSYHRIFFYVNFNIRIIITIIMIII